MYETITKKEFNTILKNSESVLLIKNYSLFEKGCTKTMKMLHDSSADTSAKFDSIKAWKEKMPTKKVGTKTDVKNGIRHYYKRDNVILSYYEYYNSFEEMYQYEIIAYVVKEIA